MDTGAIIVIIVVVIVVLGIVVSIASPLMAASSGSKVGSAFEQAYKAEFGVAPSDAAKRAISSGIAVISSFSGSGKESTLGVERLTQCITDYGQAVSWSEEKMQLGLICLGAPYLKKDGSPAFGYGWAVDVIERALLIHCPTITRDVLGY